MNAQQVDETPSLNDLVTAPLWSLAGLIENEYPQLKCKLIDLDAQSMSDNASQVINELLTKNQDKSVSFGNESRYVQKLISKKISSQQKLVPLSVERPLNLEIAVPGNLESLVYKEFCRSAPNEGEIEIKIHSTGLNFKDLLKIFGQMDPKVTEGTYYQDFLGMECSGTVVAVGKRVDNLKVGDPVVVAAAQKSFSSYVITNSQFVIPLPQGMSLNEAPILIGFITAYYSLVNLAQLQRGESVLIHSASGGVGLAAIQVAHWIGAEVHATAGTEEKRNYLKQLGIQNVMDSRTFDFANVIEKQTQGKGVDVVLNSLQGEFLYKSISILAPYGRFIEIGKKDIIENTGLPLQEFNRNLMFASVDLDRLLIERPNVVIQVLKRIEKRFKENHFKAISTTEFPAGEIDNAFRFFAKSQHIGKITLKFHEQELMSIPLNPENETFNKESTYLITGGTQGMGLEVAKWLAAKGIKQLILVSRRASEKKLDQAIRKMERSGTQVMVVNVDVTQKEHLKGLIRTIQKTCLPLKGIFHAAMVLDDSLLSDLDKECFDKVLAPKVKGTILLHQLTQHIKLDHFVLFSSVVSIIGNRGQGNYIVANSFLDAFSQYRKNLGLPAITINWGAFSDTGVVARSPHLSKILGDNGIIGMTSQEALDALDQILESEYSRIGVFNINWNKFIKTHPQLSRSSLFQHFIENDHTSSHTQENTIQKLETHLSPLSREEQISFIQKAITKQLTKVLRLPVSKIDIQQNLNELGVDSLLAMELIYSIQSELGAELSAVELLAGTSINQLTVQVLEQLNIGEENDLSYIDELTENQVDALINEIKIG